MLGSKSNSTSGLSWADEVEKEEEEARAQLHQQQKSNPFGFARPREVVLEEKGIDWRKVDKKLQECSNLSSVPRKEEQLKENIPAPTKPVKGKQQFPPRSRRMEGKIENTGNGCARTGAPLDHLTLQNENLGFFVPPFRYPPKNTMGLKEEKQCCYNSYRAEVGQSDFRDVNRRLDHQELHINRERETRIHENRKRNFTVEESMHQSMGEAHRVSTMRISTAAHGEREWENMNSKCKNRNFFGERLVGPPLVNGRRGVLLNHDRGCRSADEEFGWENMEDEYERRGGLLGPCQLPNGRGKLGHLSLNMEKAGFGGNHKNRGARPSAVEVSEWEDMAYEYGRQRFDVGEFMGPSTGAMGAHHDVNMECTGFGWENMEDEYERRKGLLGPCQLPNGGGKWGHLSLNIEKAGFGGNHKNRGARPSAVEENEWENMAYEYGRQRFDVGEFMGPSTEAMGAHRNVNMESTGFGGNYRKRGMKSGSNNSHYHQRRRR